MCKGYPLLSIGRLYLPMILAVNPGKLYLEEKRMKKSILSLALAVLMVMTLFTVGAFADGKTVSDVAELNSALEAAQDGDTIVLEAGTYDVGALRVERAVNFKGAGIGQTVIVGSINYYCDQPAENVKDITVEDLTVISPENNTTTQQAIWWGYNGAGSLSGLNLNVKNCKVVDYLLPLASIPAPRTAN